MGAPTHSADITGQQGAASTATFMPTVTASTGQTVIAAVYWNDQTHTISTITDSGSNTWNKVANTLQQSNIGFTASSQLIWSNITTGGSPLTLTITFSGAVPFPTISGSIFNDNSGVITLDQSASQNTSNPTVIASPSITTTSANDILFTSWFFNNTVVTGPTGWTGATTFNSSFYLNAWKIVTSTGTFAPAAGNGSTATAQESIIALASSFVATGVPNSLMMLGCGT